MSFLMLQCACAAAYRHGRTGIVFPDRVATLEKEARVTDFEAEFPGLGVSVGYNGPGITVTVYIYTQGLDVIPTDLESYILMDHFFKIRLTVNQANQEVAEKLQAEFLAEFGRRLNGVNKARCNLSL